MDVFSHAYWNVSKLLEIQPFYYRHTYISYTIPLYTVILYAADTNEIVLIFRKKWYTHCYVFSYFTFFNVLFFSLLFSIFVVELATAKLLLLLLLQVQSQALMKIDYASIYSIRRATLWQRHCAATMTPWMWLSACHSESSLLW